MALPLDQKKYVLEHAWVPEHSVELMVAISGAEAYLEKDHIYYWDGERLIFVGYPLQGRFKLKTLEQILDGIVKSLGPSYVNVVAPELPESMIASCQELDKDEYWRIDLGLFVLNGVLKRAVRRAQRECGLKRGRQFHSEHKQLIEEFVKRKNMSMRAKALYFSAEKLLEQTSTVEMLEVRNQSGLVAFSMVDMGPNNFSTYLLGASSARFLTPGANDLLMYQMVLMAAEAGKGFLNVGLGLNEGIRKFKSKWRAEPYIGYNHCGFQSKKPSLLDLILKVTKGR